MKWANVKQIRLRQGKIAVGYVDEALVLTLCRE